MAVTKTSISWTDSTWSPIRGCSRKSTGYENCYAEVIAGRFSGPGQPYEGLARTTSQGSKWTGEVRLIEKDLSVPLHWKKPRRIFVNSMSDLFHEDVPDSWIDQIVGMMWNCQWHTFQVLTKRPARMQHYFMRKGRARSIAFAIYKLFQAREPQKAAIVSVEDFVAAIALPFPNVWLGTSVENREQLNRLNFLCETPAHLRFASLEPLLEDLGDITPWLEPVLNAAGLDWVIVGGESGPKARPCGLGWIADLVRQCQEAAIPCFVKQLGRYAYDFPDSQGSTVKQYIHPQTRCPGCLNCRWTTKHPAGADITEFPGQLQVQQWPTR